MTTLSRLTRMLAAPLLAASMYGTSNTQAEEPANTPAKATLDDFVLDHEGDPRQGTILFLRQIHAEPKDVNNRAPDAEVQKRLVKVGSYHLKVYRALEEIKPKIIFVEDEWSTGKADDYPKQYMIKQIRDLFPAGMPSLPDDTQLGALGYYGSGFVWVCLHPGVIMHRTCTKEGLQKYDSKAQNERVVQGKPDVHYLFDVREAWAIAELKEYLDSHPGETVPLIFGAMHEFGPQFKDFNPTVYSRTWLAPEATENMRKYVKELRAQKPSP
jgi:hypothetical protein